MQNPFDDPSPFFGPSRPLVAPTRAFPAPAVISTAAVPSDTGMKVWTYALIAIIVVAIIVFNIYFFTDITQKREQSQ